MTTNTKKYNPAKDLILSNIINSVVSIADPDKIILFGSRAQNRQKTNSDYDILVLKKNIKKRRKLAQKIYLNLDGSASVDVLVCTLSRFNKLKDKWFLVYSNIDKYGKVIYEK